MPERKAELNSFKGRLSLLRLHKVHDPEFMGHSGKIILFFTS